MSKEMLINIVEGEECRIAVVEDGRLEELYLERASTERHVGNIYKARINNVEPSIQAAFLDIGQPKNGFLHVSDVLPSIYPNRGKKNRGKKKGKNTHHRRIQDIFNRGDEVLVQVTKEGIGTKGPSLTTALSIPGRYLVLMPGLSRLGVSRKIDSDKTRKALRKQLASLEPPKDLGLIVRTAGQGRSKRDLKRDMNYLLRLWKVVQNRASNAKAPAEVFRESDLVLRTLRDVYTSEIGTVWVDSEPVLKRVQEFMKIAIPRQKKNAKLYKGNVPLFHKYNLEEAIQQVYSRTVSLPKGGTIVIDQTEALVAIDVNSGSFRHGKNAEESAYQLNRMAAEEIVRQIRLRDLGGVIIMDFVDMDEANHRRAIEKIVRDAMKKDKARHRVNRMSQFGILEMTRQRVQPSLHKATYTDCPHCKGAGVVKTRESMALDVIRYIQVLANRKKVAKIEVAVHPSVADYINNQRRESLVRLEEDFNMQVRVASDMSKSPDEVQYTCFDQRGAKISSETEVMGRRQASK